MSDGLVTSHFYILCTYVKALGRCRGKDFQDHYTIRAWLNAEKDLVGIAMSYRKVEEWSRDARYEGRTFSDAEMTRLHTWFGHARDGLVDVIESEGVSGVPRVAAIAA